ncbi:MAG: FAD-dependent oxidoreductase [Acidobacteria bacterium]|nr:FAD-dependent oxidoreductase [Acidobacteriota bacterium]
MGSLAERLDGTLSLPSDSRWDEARAAWQLGIDQRPVAVVEAAGVADVVATVVAARELGLRVAAQGTGHNAAPLGELSGTILLSTRRMRAPMPDLPPFLSGRSFDEHQERRPSGGRQARAGDLSLLRPPRIRASLNECAHCAGTQRQQSRNDDGLLSKRRYLERRPRGRISDPSPRGLSHR